MKIETIKGMYKTRYGVPVTIVAYGLDGNRKILGVEHHPNCKNISNWWDSFDDLVKIPQLSNLKIDDKVMVKDYDDGDCWLNRYFAGVSARGKVLTFCDGCTSWSSNNHTAEWDQWRLPTEDEL